MNKIIVLAISSIFAASTYAGQTTVQSTNAPFTPKLSAYLEYTGATLETDDAEDDVQFDGVGVGLSADLEYGFVTSFGYQYQVETDSKSNEIQAKLGYKFYDANNAYATASVGLGYSWLSFDDVDLDLRYLTIPFDVEVGYYFQPNLALYVGTGYKWMNNQNIDGCIEGYCISGYSDSALDLDGFSYKAGIRYQF